MSLKLTFAIVAWMVVLWADGDYAATATQLEKELAAVRPEERWKLALVSSGVVSLTK